MSHNRNATSPADEGVDLSIKSLSKQEFGKRLWALIVRKGWSQSDLSRASGIGRDSISNYIRGKTIPTAQAVYKLAESLGVQPEEILPNLIEQAVDDEVPALEIREAHGTPGKAWIRMNRMVTMDQASRILSIVNEG